MAHGITSTDTMMAVGAVPWHGLGAVFKKQPKNIRQAVEWSGLSKWRVKQVPLVLGEHVTAAAKAKTTAARQEFYVPGYLANVRSDTGDVLGIVTPDYQVVQVEQALQFAEAILGEARIITLGSLFGGKAYFATFEIPEHIEVGGDTIVPYFGLSGWHTGTGSIRSYPTPIRQVCNNTVRAAINQATGIYAVRHVGDITAQVHEARQVLDITVDYYKQFAKFGNKLATQRMAERKLQAVLDELYPTGTMDVGPRGRKTRQRAKDAVMELSKRGDTIGNAAGSKWSAWNAIVQVYDHNGRARMPESGFVRKVNDPDGFKARALELVASA